MSNQLGVDQPIVSRRVEFILLMAAMSALDAFSIDGMLPALDQIGSDLNVRVENRRQYVITALFFGFSIGVLLYGFAADRYGRRVPVLCGFAVYIFGTLACIYASSFSVLLAGRVLQGVGAAGPYVLSVAIVRDSYKGAEMARILSLIMMVFIGVPMIAPFIGQGLMLLSGWRSIFVALLVFALVTMLWFWWRQAESLPVEKRQQLSLLSIGGTVVEVVTNRQTVRYLMALGLLSGAFIAYLSTAQQIFQDIFGTGQRFPLIFASLASVFGVGAYVNSRLVAQTGERKLVLFALLLILFASLLLLFSSLFFQITLIIYLAYISVIMFCFAMLFGNVTALAMEPMGHIAGAASSLIASGSTVVAVALAAITGSQLGNTVAPVVVGFGAASAIALALVWVQSKSGDGLSG